MRSGWKTGSRNGMWCGPAPTTANSSSPTTWFEFPILMFIIFLKTNNYNFFVKLSLIFFNFQERKEFVDLFQNLLKGKLVKMSKWKLSRKNVVKFQFQNKVLIVGNKWCHCSWKRFAWKLISLYRDKNANWNHEKTAGKNWGFLNNFYYENDI